MLVNDRKLLSNGFYDSFVFVTAPDGRRLCFPFFPCAIFGRAYVISDADVARLRRLIATSTAILLGAAIPATMLPPEIAGFVMLAVGVSYYAWMSYRLRGLEPSPARLTLRESMIAQARAHDLASLFVGMVGSFGFFVGGGVFIIDRAWPVAAVTIAFGGLCGASYTAIFVVWCWVALPERWRRDAV